MNKHFPRLLTLLRKERGLSQKKAAEELGVSQALLSHYEKGIRECGLDFVVRAADYYQVSCDYLLGRSPDKTGATITLEDIPEPDAAGKENRMKGSLLPLLNKKLLANSLNVIFGELQKCNNKYLTGEVSAYLNVSVYKAFRLLYSANPKIYLYRKIFKHLALMASMLNKPCAIADFTAAKSFSGVAIPSRISFPANRAITDGLVL